MTLLLSSQIWGAERVNLNSLIKNSIARNFNGARIELLSSMQWVRGSFSPSQISRATEVLFLDEDGRGTAHLSVSNKNERNSSHGISAEGWVHFSAWIPAKISLRRIKPAELLTPDMFITQELNISTGQGHEYRGVLLPDSVSVAGLETIQSVLEGQFLVSSAVQRVPDVRRGDSVRVHLISGGLTLSTLGVAEEPSYLNRQVRVMTGKNKRELLGQLQADGVVEVNL
jgi:flagella basal body P-ring formation protein FlgA